MSQVYPLSYTLASIERIRIVWVDGKRVRYQNLPFLEHMEKTAPYYKTEDQKNAIISQLNAYFEVFCKACILENIK